MQKNLVIVESPAKAKTIEKFLGSDYKVMSSYGHIRDLKKKEMSINEKSLEPEYEIPEEKEKLVKELKSNAEKAEKVWLASDEDREGEAISWHLCEVLGLDKKKTNRIVFHEITKPAILQAIEHPRHLDMNLVNAQQARRVLDRLVGFKLSPVLWRKVKPALSAGRVQSVAVRLIVEREREIQNFKSESFYNINGIFAITNADGSQTEVKAALVQRLKTHEEVEQLLEKCKEATYTVSAVSKKPLKRTPAPPFTTSTLQQEAARKLGFTVAQTMMVAQRLYEAGHITYMRTDSMNLSDEAMTAIAGEITRNIGPEYLTARHYHTHSKGAQEAHEAIRPTDVSVTVPADTNDREKKLYTLIRRRAIASQMADARFEKTTAEIVSPDVPEHFTAVGETVTFDGFLHVYAEGRDDDQAEPQGGLLPRLTGNMPLAVNEITATERFTQQPPRYTEASLVKKMEELGIGRPSTYAPTISTIQHREYIERGEREGQRRDFTVLRADADGNITRETHSEIAGNEKGKLIPTDIGMVVNEFLTRYFPEILDYNFTARVEERFDDIAEGKFPWNSEIKTFYDRFHPAIDSTMNMRMEHKVGERLLGTDPQGRPVTVKIGRFGPLVQVGDSEGDNKPLFASLLKGQSMSTITLDEALKLFEFPRELGQFEGKDVTVAIGRFGPYVRHNGKFVSIPKTMAPAAVTLEEAIALIEEKRHSEAERIVKTFPDEPGIQILNGRYGVYIAAAGKNYKIPKTVTEPAALSLDQVREIVRAQDEKPAKPRTRRTASSTKKS